MGIDSEGAQEKTDAQIIVEYKNTIAKLNDQLAIANKQLAELHDVVRGLFAWRDATTRAKALNGYWDTALSMLPENKPEVK